MGGLLSAAAYLIAAFFIANLGLALIAGDSARVTGLSAGLLQAGALCLLAALWAGAELLLGKPETLEKEPEGEAQP